MAKRQGLHLLCYLCHSVAQGGEVSNASSLSRPYTVSLYTMATKLCAEYEYFEERLVPCYDPVLVRAVHSLPLLCAADSLSKFSPIDTDFLESLCSPFAVTALAGYSLKTGTATDRDFKHLSAGSS